MASFEGRLRVVGQSGFPLGVEVDLTEERMVVNTEAGQIADWSLEDISIFDTASGFRIDAEGEAVILNITDSERFASQIKPRIERL